MKLASRTEASLEISYGHLVRCLTLLKALSDRGWGPTQTFGSEH
jgi:spore coat polysaccharide biosynthesis predicted glycosyltransferase SpsG